jgi:hypothetical protein
MSSTSPDQPGMPGTPTDSGGPTPVSSRWDLTVRPPTPNRPLGRAATDPNFQAGSSETTRLLATKHPKYWDVTDSETEERGRGGKSTAGAPRSGEWRGWRARACARLMRRGSTDSSVDGEHPAPAEGYARRQEDPPALQVLRPRAFSGMASR